MWKIQKTKGPKIKKYETFSVTSNHSSFFIFYNSSRKICILPEKISRNIREILPLLFSTFSNDSYLWICTNNPDFYTILAQNGFNSPYISDRMPGGTEIPISVCLSRMNIPTEKYDVISTLNKIHDLLSHECTDDSCSCVLRAQFSTKALSFLQQASKMGNNREIGGELHTHQVIRDEKGSIYIVDVNENNLSSGEEEDVNIESTRYNFHSHPEEAYIRHSVHKAWPSLTDFLGYLKLGHRTIFHCVATLEGLYIMSFSPYWSDKTEKIPVDFVRKNYHVERKKEITSEDFCKKVNSITLENSPIFHVQYFPWEYAGYPFTIYYAKTNGACIPTEKGMKKFLKFTDK